MLRGNSDSRTWGGILYESASIIILSAVVGCSSNSITSEAFSTNSIASGLIVFLKPALFLHKGIIGQTQRGSAVVSSSPYTSTEKPIIHFYAIRVVRAGITPRASTAVRTRSTQFIPNTSTWRLREKNVHETSRAR